MIVMCRRKLKEKKLTGKKKSTPNKGYNKKVNEGWL